MTLSLPYMRRSTGLTSSAVRWPGIPTQTAEKLASVIGKMTATAEDVVQAPVVSVHCSHIWFNQFAGTRLIRAWQPSLQTASKSFSGGNIASGSGMAHRLLYHIHSLGPGLMRSEGVQSGVTWNSMSYAHMFFLISPAKVDDLFVT